MSKKQQKKNKFFNMKMSANDEKSADIFIYGEITAYAWEEYGEVSATAFKNELDGWGDIETINLYINSPGGQVFEGISIHNMLLRHKAKVIVHIDALAASIASVIAMAGDEIRMPKNSMLMIHNPMNIVIGNAVEMRKAADDLDRIGNSAIQSYLQKAGGKLDEETLKQLLEAETWLSADEALNLGLCDVVEEASLMVASISDDLFEKYKNVPEQYTEEQQTTVLSPEELNERQRIAEDAKAGAQNMKTILGGII